MAGSGDRWRDNPPLATYASNCSYAVSSDLAPTQELLLHAGEVNASYLLDYFRLFLFNFLERLK